MNELNYATLEVSQSLIDKGIVLETEAVWNYWIHGKYFLVLEKDRTCGKDNCVPAPSLAEVWRELPETDELMDIVRQYAEVTAEFWQVLLIQRYVFNLLRDVNKMIDLLIWITEKKRKESNK